MPEKVAARSWADRLTISRMIGAPLLIVAAWCGQPQAFLAIAVAGLLTDAGDGTVARLLRNASARGAQLDSRADLAFYTGVLSGLVLLFPGAFAAEWRTGIVVVLAYAAPIGVGWFKFRQLTAYHTLLARAALLTAGVGFFCWLWLGFVVPLRLATIVLVVAAVEELAITWKLAVPRNDVAHIFQIL